MPADHAHQNNWLWDEFEHIGTDYNDVEEVRRYDERMLEIRDVAGENVRILDALNLQPGATLVEIGCGTASFAIAAAGRCRRVLVLDISRVMLEYARAKAKQAGVSNIEFRHGGFLSYEHSGEGVDAVVSSLALHHLPDFWKSVALCRVAAMLKPGGRFVLTDVVYSFQGEPSEFFPAFIDQLPDAMRSSAANHIAKEHSTLDWIMRGLLERTGFHVDNAVHEMGWIGRYMCTRP